jgi:hypothetical protein
LAARPRSGRPVARGERLWNARLTEGRGSPLSATGPHEGLISEAELRLPRRQLTDDSAIMDFLLSSNVGKFDMYVEDQCAAYVRYCFQDPMDAAIFRSRFEQKSKPFRLAG